MASLSISITQGSYNEADNSVMVSVSVRISYGAESWNASGGSGTLYVNDVPFSFSATFNENQSGAGSKTLYSTSVCIDLNVTNVVSCSAIYDYGSAGGPISASNSKTISAGGSSGGDSGGDSGDGGLDYDDPNNEGGTVYRTARFTVGEHTSITYMDTNGSEVTISENKSVIFPPSNNPIKVTFKADVGYSLFNCSVGDSICENVGYFDAPGNGSEIEIKSSAIPTGAVRIEPESGAEDVFPIYQIFIDTKHTERETYSSNCVFDGYGDENNTASNTLYYYTGQIFRVGGGYTAFLKFTTPSFTGDSNKLFLTIGLSGSFRSALLNSDANWKLYVGHSSSVTTDEHQILSCQIEPTGKTYDPVIIPASGLKQNTTYYYVIWGDDGNGDRTVVGDSISIVIESIDPVDPDHPDYVIKQDLYAPYVDNGIGWDIYH